MKSEVKEEIQTYIRYINENDFRDKCEEYIQMFFFLSQMMLEESLGADERVIQSMAQKMVGLLGQDLDIDFASPNDMGDWECLRFQLMRSWEGQES